MSVIIRRFQNPSCTYPNSWSLLNNLDKSKKVKMGSLLLFARVLSVLMAALAMLVMTAFSLQSPHIIPAALYIGAFFSIAVLICVTILVMKNILCFYVPKLKLGLPYLCS